MFDREIKLYAFMLQYCRLLTNDIEESQMSVQPTPGVNPPVWILGHLAAATDYATRMLGEKAVLPESWHRMFGRGSKLLEDTQPYPTKKELLAAIEAGHERVTAAARNADPERLAGPHNVDLLKDLLPTMGDVVAHLMTTHPATHLGQLSAWRRQMGKPA